MSRKYILFNVFLIIIIGILVMVKPSEKSFSVNSLSNSLKNIDISDNSHTIVNSIDIGSASLDLHNNVFNNVANANVISDVIETTVGTMSSYGPDCVGCSGGLAGGFNARGGSYIYHDSEYGDVRILAGDSSYPFGTIFRVKGNFGEFNAIVLDRGGGIGFGKRFLFDLLFPSEAAASQFGTHYNVVFEMLRRGH